MSTSTDPSPPTRARVHEQTAATSSPTEAAEAAIAAAVASLPAPAQPSFLGVANKALAIFKQISKRERSIASLEREDYIPRSVRSSFQLNASKSVSETAEFKALQKRAQRIIDHYQMSMKDVVVSAAKIELAQLNRQYALHIVSAVGCLSKSLLLIETGLEPSDQKTSAVCARALRNLESVAPIGTLPALDIQQAIRPYSLSPLPPALDLTTAVTIAIAESVAQHITGLCISPCSRYKEQETANRVAMQVTAFESPIQYDTPAAETSAHLDNEPAVDDVPTVDPKLLNAMIKKSIDKALSRQAHQLSLRGARGATDYDASIRASLKKKEENDRKAAAGRLLAAERKKAENDRKAAAGRRQAAAAKRSSSKKPSKGNGKH